MELNRSATMENLMRAFAGESQARNRYTFAAEYCREQGLYALSEAFLFTADQERAHAKVFYDHLKALSPAVLPVEGTYPIAVTEAPLALLRAAEAGETEEWETVYPAFAKTADQEGFPAVAHSFRLIAQVEALHARRFAHLRKAMEEGTLYAAAGSETWMCLNCGHIHTGKAVPERCPLCQHPQGFFLPLLLAPYTSASMG